MADNKNQDCEMNGEDFSQDVSATNEKENGGTTGTNGNESNNARDDDRYLRKMSNLKPCLASEYLRILDLLIQMCGYVNQNFYVALGEFRVKFNTPHVHPDVKYN